MDMLRRVEVGHAMTCDHCGNWIHGAPMVVAVIDHATYSCGKGRQNGMAYEGGKELDATDIVGARNRVPAYA